MVSIKTMTLRAPDGTEMEVSDVEFTVESISGRTLKEVRIDEKTGERTEVVELDLVKVVENNIAVLGVVTRNAIQATFRQVVLDLTGPARRKKAPHQYRPDLRGSGMPRKRGKGKY